MTETQLFQSFKNCMAVAGSSIHLQRIETSTSNGVPDLNVCYSGREFWIELKTKKGTFLSQMRNEQISWTLRRVWAGGRCFGLSHWQSTYSLYLLECNKNGLTVKILKERDCLIEICRALEHHLL